MFWNLILEAKEVSLLTLGKTQSYTYTFRASFKIPEFNAKEPFYIGEFVALKSACVPQNTKCCKGCEIRTLT